MMLDVLRRQQVKVTFFVANERTKTGDGSLGNDWGTWWKSVAAEGHEFASHTYDHVYWRGDLPGIQTRFRMRPSAGAFEGREFTCLIAENPDDANNPITFKPVEFIFPNGESFKHYDMKWVDYEKMSVAVVTDPRIEKILREQTMRVFKELGGNGYARCDFRMDANGEIHMLEINPNCGIFYPPHEPGSADYSLMNDKHIDHTKFMKLIIRSGERRQTRMAAEKIIKRQRRKRVLEVEQMAFT